MGTTNGNGIQRKMRVAILGAGMTGISTLKVFSEHPDRFDLTCYEKSATYGGEWIYTEDTTITETTRPSAIYTYLKTNSNRVANSLPGLMIDSQRQWNTHTEITAYIHEYVSFFNLTKYMQFETEVKKVTCLPQHDGKELWNVVTETIDGVRSEKIFDAVVVGTGPWGKPRVPHYAGEETFKGDISHSCQFRRPQKYTDKTVLVIGGLTSGQDITDQICQFAKKVYSNTKMPIVDPENLEQTGARYISHYKESSVVMKDGQELEVDAVVYCTGYKTEFPYLDETCSVEDMEGLTYPVYKFMVHARHPTLFFNALLKGVYIGVIPLLTQAQCNLLLGKAELPSVKCMLHEITSEIDKYRTAKRPLKGMSFMLYLDGTFKVLKDICRLCDVHYPVDQFEIMYGTFTYFSKAMNKFRDHAIVRDEDGKVVKKLLPKSESGLRCGFPDNF